MVKSLIEISSELPWTSDFDFYFESDALLFTIFLNDPILSLLDKTELLRHVYLELTQWMKPWVRYYPWNDQCLKLELVENYAPEQQLDKEQYSYIFGTVQFAEGISDEWLVVSLVLQFFQSLKKRQEEAKQQENNYGLDISKDQKHGNLKDNFSPHSDKNKSKKNFLRNQTASRGSSSSISRSSSSSKQFSQLNLHDIHIHFFDQDGEFLLIESINHIPSWCEPSNTFNRVWFNGLGELLLISDILVPEQQQQQQQKNRNNISLGYLQQPHPQLHPYKIIPCTTPISSTKIKSLNLKESLWFLTHHSYRANKATLESATRHLWETKLSVTKGINLALLYDLTAAVILPREVARLVVFGVPFVDEVFGSVRGDNNNNNNNNNNTEFENLNLFTRSIAAFINQQLLLSASKLKREIVGRGATHKSNYKNQTNHSDSHSNADSSADDNGEDSDDNGEDLVLVKVRIPLLWHKILKIAFTKLQNPSKNQSQNQNRNENIKTRPQFQQQHADSDFDNDALFGYFLGEAYVRGLEYLVDVDHEAEKYVCLAMGVDSTNEKRQNKLKSSTGKTKRVAKDANGDDVEMASQHDAQTKTLQSKSQKQENNNNGNGDGKISDIGYRCLSNGDIVQYNKFVSRDNLQNWLVEKLKLIDSKVESLDPEGVEEVEGNDADADADDKDELMNKIRNFVLDKDIEEVNGNEKRKTDTAGNTNRRSAKIEEVETNKNIKTAAGSSSNTNGKSGKKIDLNLDEHYNDASDYDTDNENEKVLNYFKNENVTINEDDFFEFFLTEALKLPKEELEGYRASGILHGPETGKPVSDRNKHFQSSKENKSENGKNGEPTIGRKRKLTDDNGAGSNINSPPFRNLGNFGNNVSFDDGNDGGESKNLDGLDDFDDFDNYDENSLAENLSNEDMQQLAELVNMLKTSSGAEGPGGPGAAFLQNFGSGLGI